MTERTSRYAEIVINLMPSRRKANDEPRPDESATVGNEQTRHYDALVYTNLDLPGLTKSDEYALGQQSEIAQLPLVSVEQVTIHWDHYKEYEAEFAKGEKAANQKLWSNLTMRGKGGGTVQEIRNKVLETDSLALKALFNGEPQLHSPVRVWWNVTAPELACLPWELLAYEHRNKADSKFSFVRGLPPKSPAPKVPVSGRLRLAFIHSPSRTPDALKTALADQTEIEVVPMITEPPRAALQRAVREGFELIHIVADGSVSLASEGILYFRKSDSSASEGPGPLVRGIIRLLLNVSPLKLFVPDSLILSASEVLYSKLNLETCSPGELSMLLHGSRVTLLSLTPPKSSEAGVSHWDDLFLPSVYRAFAALGSSLVPLPNIVAPLGAVSEERLTSFWRGFYKQLGDKSCRSVEEAMACGQKEGPPVPIALFLRQRLGREFVYLAADRPAPSRDPAQVNAELQAARELLEQLQSVDAKYLDLKDKVTETPLAHEESARQEQLAADLNEYTQLEADEP